jgi:autotransporter-associated beta strand protein
MRIQPRLRSHCRTTALILVGTIAALLAGQPARAAVYFWDADADTTAATGGTGNWDTATSLWRAGSSTGTLGTWLTSGTDNDAHLGGTAGTLTLTTGISVNDITVNPTSGTAYTIAGTQILTLAGTAQSVIDVASGDTLTITSGLAGTNGFTKSNMGTLTLTGANTLTGNTTVNGGTLALGFGTVSSNILSISSALTLGGGRLQLTGTGTQTVNGLTTTADTVSNILLSANQTLTLGAGSLGSDSSLNFNTAAGGANANTPTVGTGIVVLAGQTPGNVIGNYKFTVTDAGGFGLATVNASNQVIRLTSTRLPASGAGSTTDYRIDNNAGSASVAGSRTLTISASESARSITVDTGAANGVLTLSSGILLSNNTWIFGGTGTNTYQITGSTSGAGLRAVASGDALVFNNYNSGAVTISSPILANGTNSVTVFGTGTLIFAGANGYTGSTTVRGGTLTVNGSTAAGSAVTVASGATLGGRGTVAGTVAAQGSIAPGAGLTAGNFATLRTGAITFSGTGSLVGNVGAVFHDSLVVNGTANLSGTLTVNATNPDQSLYTLLSATSVTGAFTTLSIPTGYGVQVTPTEILLGKLVITAPSLTASDRLTNDFFGISVSQLGSIGLVGASGDNSGQGSAYVFRSLDTATGTITQNVKLTASDGATDDFLGGSVSLSGSIGLLGARRDDTANADQGSAYVFRSLDTATGTITQNVKLTASDGAASDVFGTSVSLSGNIGLVGATGDDIGANNQQGSAYVFRSLDTATGAINQNVKLTASDGAAEDGLGSSVSLAGSIGLVGAYRDTIGANNQQGSAYVFRSLDTAPGAITQNVKLTASDGLGGDQFGISVSLSGSIGLVGASGTHPKQGSAYVFRSLDTATGAITQNVKLTASDGATDDLFGISVSLSGRIGLVGASRDDIGTQLDQGSAYVFRSLDTATDTITQNVKLTASDGAASDRFGISVSLSGDQFTIGSQGKNSNTGKAYTGTVSSVTTLDLGNANRTIDGLSFVSQDDWIIGQTSSSNQVTLNAGNTADVTAVGKVVSIGQNSGSNNNTLVIAGTLTATQINVGAAGNSGNVLQIGNGGSTGALSTSSVITNNGSVVFNRSVATTQGTHFGSAAITGTGSLTQAGTGTTTLNVANTYSGDTTVHAGTLKLDLAGSISNSANIIVGDAGSTGTHLDVTTKTGGLSIGLGVAQTLKGIGQIDGTTTIASLGIHAPGNSPGLQTFNGNLAYSTGAMLNWELATNSVGTRGTDFDGIDVIGAGTLSIASGVTSNLIFNAVGSAVDWSDTFWDSNQSWLVYDDANLPTLSSASIFDTINVSTDSLGATLSGGAFSWAQSGNDVFLNFTASPIPEPGTATLLGIACIGVAALRRRRRV